MEEPLKESGSPDARKEGLVSPAYYRVLVRKDRKPNGEQGDLHVNKREFTLEEAMEYIKSVSPSRQPEVVAVVHRVTDE